MKKAVVFDDQALFAETFSMLLEKIGIFTAVITYTSEADIRQFFIHEFHPEDDELYLFSDFLVPGCNVTALLNDIRKFRKSTHIILVTSVLSPDLVAHAMQAQPQGFISKSHGVTEIVAAVNAIDNGKTYMAPAIHEVLDKRKNQERITIFSSREMDILRLIERGYSIKEMAAELILSTHTIVAHRRNMMAKAGCNSVTALLAFAMNHGLVSKAN